MSSYADIPLPTSLAERLQQLHRLAQPPPTLGDYVVALKQAGRGQTWDPAALCCSDSRHEIEMGGETRHTYCVFDTLLLAAMAHAAASIKSTSPLSGEVISIGLTSDLLVVEPSHAVMSYGLLREGPGDTCELLCPYVNAFASLDEFERWAAATPQAITVPLTIPQAAQFARDFVDTAGCC